MEADLHVDDVVVDLYDGTRAFIQAKLTARNKAFEDTVDQWCRSVTSGECRPGDELLFVVAQPTKVFLDLADALAVRRRGASLTASATKHIDRVCKLAVGHGLDGRARERLLHAAAIRALDARDNGPDEALGSACLNAAVVAAGHGRAAFIALREAAHTQAEQRTTSDLAIWRSWLTRGHLPLIADVSGTAAARLEALERVVRRYREEWSRKQDTIPLADLGLGLTSMTVPGMAKDLHASPPGQKHGRDQLVDAVRRQGRLFVVGSPGTGKTIASRAIAARWAANDRAPIPVWLRLRDLMPRLSAVGPYRIEADDLVRAAVGDTQPLLTEALLAYIARGNALLVLDALDETLERRDAVVEAVADLLSRLPAEIDVLVTSRHSCIKSAALLHLPVYELQTPWKLSDTLDQLLEAVAEQLGGEANKDEWKAEHRARIAHSRSAEPDLWRVPLLATLMVLLTTQRSAHSAPSGRAALLEEVIDSSVRLWEMRRAVPAVPDTAPALTADILVDCFDDIARLVAVHGSTSWHQAHSAVNTRLQHHWGKPAGTAAAAARHILEYWDATAGVFISDAPHGTLTARTRLFAEIGEARWAIRDPSALTAWMNEAATRRPESARLAASLSPDAAGALIARAIDSGGQLLELVHAAVQDGVGFDEALLHAYRQAQLDRLATVPDRYPPAPPHVIDLDAKRSPRAELIVLLASENLDMAQADQLIRAAAAMSHRLEAVVVALRVHQQALRRGRDLTDRELDVVQGALEALVSVSTEEIEDPAYFHGSDALVRAAVIHLLPRKPELASALANVTSHISLNTLEWLETELPRLGHAATLKSIRESSGSEVLARLARSFKDISALFELMTELDDSAVALTPGQAWHLEEAATFVDDLGIGDFAAMTPPAAARQQPDLTRSILRIALKACGYNGALISAQLRSLKKENPGRADWGLLYLPSTRTFAGQPASVTVDDDLLLDVLQHGNAWLVTLTLALAGDSPSPDSRLAEHLTPRLPALNARTRMQAARFLTHHWPDVALPGDDGAIRAGAASARAAAHADGGRHRDALPLLTDPDLLVRAQAAHRLSDIAPRDLPQLEQALATAAQQWTCLGCGTTVSADARTCGCKHARPKPRFPDQP
ncbi:NACHT domain-containing protein [Streptomyces smyrnaeus]|uniref:NACHT domain-containing protein n=1 Tax=Streptomyces smyrnaeus TaxID=1387713 RepID=A0ABS3XQP5_9ACTN|nr:NACHT domain-containing protein [Streptomyces smyrnaeus]MBO8197734.1 NACHT domain-containing protein [Streptomyces smyrnaeus]